MWWERNMKLVGVRVEGLMQAGDWPWLALWLRPKGTNSEEWQRHILHPAFWGNIIVYDQKHQLVKRWINKHKRNKSSNSRLNCYWQGIKQLGKEKKNCSYLRELFSKWLDWITCKPHIASSMSTRSFSIKSQTWRNHSPWPIHSTRISESNLPTDGSNPFCSSLSSSAGRFYLHHYLITRPVFRSNTKNSLGLTPLWWTIYCTPGNTEHICWRQLTLLPPEAPVNTGSFGSKTAVCYEEPHSNLSGRRQATAQESDTFRPDQETSGCLNCLSLADLVQYKCRL